MVKFNLTETINGQYQLIVDTAQQGVGGAKPVASIIWRLCDLSGATIRQGTICYNTPALWTYFSTNFNTWGWLYSEVSSKAGIDIPFGTIIETQLTGQTA